MCGRFSLTQRLEVLERIFKAKARAKLTLPRYNIAPTQPIAVICGDDPETIDEIDWGITVVPSTGDPPRTLVNAKAETLQQRPAYADAFRTRRCIILADGFYEWHTNGKHRYPRYFRLRDRQPFAFAGIYTEENGRRQGVIVTTQANATVAQAHNRMPVMLRDPQAWLADESPEQLQGLLVPYQDDEMESFNVNPVVNSPENDSPECIDPFEPPQLGLFG